MGVTIFIIASIILFIGYIIGEKEAEKHYELRKKDLEKEFANTQDKLKTKFKLLEQISTCSFIFERVASLHADLKTYVYDEVAYGLKNRNRPAFKAADEIKEFKKKTKEAIENSKLMQYKYEFLMNQFPSLKEYVDDYEAVLSSLNGACTIEEASNMHDRVKDWIPENDYKRLDENTRNQIALDNWLRYRKISNTQIGYEYELYIGYLYKRNGWTVIQYGIDKGLDDLGRDVIAHKIINGKYTTHIIQCKRWSEHKNIHENVISQLYGTCIQYKLSHNLIENNNRDVVPVLFSTTALSQTAQKFAKYLNVSVQIAKMGEYPRIKCNINQSTGEKIYHLPFDQQYYTSKINQPGEFFAFTVKEAADKGFRRAFRHIN